jgi:hypothetical protein
MTTASTTAIVPGSPTPKGEVKSWSQSFVERARAELAAAPPVDVGAYVRETASLAGEYTEGALTGSLLGATHARFGLDTTYGPADGWLAVLGALVGIAASCHAPFLAARARGAGAKAFTILAFRKSYELIAHEPLPGGVATSGGVRRIATPTGGAPGVTRPDPIELAAEGIDGLE